MMLLYAAGQGAGRWMCTDCLNKAQHGSDDTDVYT